MTMDEGYKEECYLVAFWDHLITYVKLSDQCEMLGLTHIISKGPCRKIPKIVHFVPHRDIGCNFLLQCFH